MKKYMILIYDVREVYPMEHIDLECNLKEAEEKFDEYVRFATSARRIQGVKLVEGRPGDVTKIIDGCFWPGRRLAK